MSSRVTLWGPYSSRWPSIDPVIQSLHSLPNVWYLDDEILAEPADTVAADISTLLPALQRIGLTLNQQKNELVELGDASILGNLGSSTTHDDVNTTEAERLHYISNAFGNTDRPGATNSDVNPPANPEATTPPELSEAHRTSLRELALLGAPISSDAVPEATEAASHVTARLIERMEKIDSHTARFFLSHYASAPRYTYLMHTAPTFLGTQQLCAIDEGMHAAIMRTCNISLSNDNWIQASLLTLLGGIGVRHMEDVALPA